MTAVAEDLGSDLYVSVEEEDDAELAAGTQAGFEASRRESYYLIPTSPQVTGLRACHNPEGPRLGLIAVLAAHRRRGLARALLGLAFSVLSERGQSEVTAEVDGMNVASTTLLTGLGARRTGGLGELVRRH